ncbi:MAG: FHA domain-containing protein [Archangium sp.]|nr:FHA domain-containing protein [Archangium sp.]
MSGRTRIARVAGHAGPEQAHLATMVFGAAPPSPAPTDSYLRLHRVIRAACLEETRPGVFIFAAHRDVPTGRLWLAATEAPRAGTLGRHESVDLPIASEAALSLRHVLFVVRLVAGRVRFSAIDLETPGGLHTRGGAQRVTESERPTLLRTAGLSFFCVPTGPNSALPVDAFDARRLLEEPPRSRQPSLAELFLRRPGGGLTMCLGDQVLPLTVDAAMLERGVLIGQQERCDVLIPDRFVSRVHAVAVTIEGVPYLVDTGSTNGTWHHSAVQVKCWKLEDGDRFAVGRATVEWRSS